jgi:hypothetical protein
VQIADLNCIPTVTFGTSGFTGRESKMAAQKHLLPRQRQVEQLDVADMLIRKLMSYKI